MRKFILVIAFVLSLAFVVDGCKHKPKPDQVGTIQNPTTEPYVPPQPPPATTPATTPSATGIPPIGPTFPPVIVVPPPATAPSTTK